MIEWARAAIARGTTLNAVAALLEIDLKTLVAWMRPATTRSPVLVPVEVIAAPALTSRAPTAVALIAPSRFRIEGLTLDDALRALARLR